MTTLTTYSAMLADTLDVVPTSGEWQMEPKFDGHRCMAYITESGCILVNPRGVGGEIWQVPYVNESLAARCKPGTVIDGELCSRGDDWSTVQSIVTTHREDRSLTIVFQAFDVLEVEGQEVTRLALRDRRRLLEALFKGRKADEHFKLVPRRNASEEYLRELLAAGYEGAVVKRLDSRYREGSKGGGWFKLKPQTTCEVVLIGFYDPKPGSKYEGNAVGGIRFRTEWGYEGKAAGMTDPLRRDMFENPDDYIGLIVELAHHGVQPSGALKSPQFKRFRTDKRSLTSRREAGKRGVKTPGTARRGKAPSGPARGEAAVGAREASTADKPRRMRKYGLMKDEKLLRVIRELENGGEAYLRCINNGSGDPAADLRHARKLATERGLL